MNTIVLDTNVLLDRPFREILKSLDAPTRVVVPLTVLFELDTFKQGMETKNVYCRDAIRFLDDLCLIGPISEGVPFEGHIVQIAITDQELNLAKNDNKIIKTAQDMNATLISQDIAERVIAHALGIDTSNFAPYDVDVSKLYTGHRVIEISDEEVQEFFNRNNEGLDPGSRRLVHNQFVTMRDSLGGEHEGIYKADVRKIIPLKSEYRAYGITPKKDKRGKIISEQKFLMHLLLDPDIHFVSALGPSGCGKTLETLAAALEQTLGKSSIYNKIIVMRPLVPIGADIGFLPGPKEEKLEAWMGSTFDNLEYLLQKYEMKDGGMYASPREKVLDLMQSDRLELEAMTYIRGRSIPNQFIIVDDSQNLTQQQAASIITRAGEGTKVVFLGDISEKQIDNHRLTPSSNGLAYVVDRLKGEDIVGHITMKTVVRSRLAQLGVEKL